MGLANLTPAARRFMPVFSVTIELPRPETRFDAQANTKQAPLRRRLLFGNRGDTHSVSGAIRGTQWISDNLRLVTIYLVLSVPLRLAIFFAAGMYRRLWRHASVGELKPIIVGAARRRARLRPDRARRTSRRHEPYRDAGSLLGRLHRHLPHRRPDRASPPHGEDRPPRLHAAAQGRHWQAGSDRRRRRRRQARRQGAVRIVAPARPRADRVRRLRRDQARPHAGRPSRLRPAGPHPRDRRAVRRRRDHHRDAVGAGHGHSSGRQRCPFLWDSHANGSVASRDHLQAGQRHRASRSPDRGPSPPRRGRDRPCRRRRAGDERDGSHHRRRRIDRKRALPPAGAPRPVATDPPRPRRELDLRHLPGALAELPRRRDHSGNRRRSRPRTNFLRSSRSIARTLSSTPPRTSTCR